MLNSFRTRTFESGTATVQSNISTALALTVSKATWAQFTVSNGDTGTLHTQQSKPITQTRVRTNCHG